MHRRLCLAYPIHSRACSHSVYLGGADWAVCWTLGWQVWDRHIASHPEEGRGRCRKDLRGVPTDGPGRVYHSPSSSLPLSCTVIHIMHAPSHHLCMRLPRPAIPSHCLARQPQGAARSISALVSGASCLRSDPCAPLTACAKALHGRMFDNRIVAAAYYPHELYTERMF